jgi:SAM-dependent methyltransferase
MRIQSDVAAQRAYYSRTAAAYDAEHIDPADEHAVALAWMMSLIEQRGVASVLDVGSGTGRALLAIKGRTGVRLAGVEPSPELRAIGYRKGLSEAELTAGDALALQFPDESFDLVCAFGILHHIRDHRRAIAEMCRVAKRALFISDGNNFGQGSQPTRAFKQGLRAAGLWSLADLVRTGFKGYHYSEGDGVFYSYSLFDDLPLIRKRFSDLMFMSTRPSGANLYRTAGSVALFASAPSLPSPHMGKDKGAKTASTT